MHCYLHWVRNGWSCLDLTSLKSVPKLINDFFLSLCRVLAVTTIQTTTKITIYQNEGESVAFYLLINDFSHNLKWAISGILVYFRSLQTVLPKAGLEPTHFDLWENALAAKPQTRLTYPFSSFNA